MKKEKVESILKTARHLFGRYGIRKTNLEEVARLSKVAKATIYNYFGSKDQVYMEVLNREVVDVAARISAAVEQMKSPVEKLRAFIYITFKLIKETADLLNLHSDITDRFIPRTGSVHKTLFARQTAILQDILKEGVKAGVFKGDDLSTTRSILYAIRGVELSWLLDRDNTEVEADLDGLFKLLCKGILVNKGVSYV